MSSLARAMLQAQREPLRLVIFDCDGVLIDSEPIADRIVAEELTVVGWPVTQAEVHARFLGMRTPDMPPSAPNERISAASQLRTGRRRDNREKSE